jgi:hypothetical protein
VAQARNRAELVIDDNQAAALAEAIENRDLPGGPVRPGRALVAGLGAALLAGLGWGLVASQAGRFLSLAMLGIGLVTGIAARRFGGVGRAVQMASASATMIGIGVGWQCVVSGLAGHWVAPFLWLRLLGAMLGGFDLLVAAFALYLAWKLPSG